MHVLSRRSNEAIVFPSLGVTIHILSVEEGVVHLGIEAPPGVEVVPAELLAKIAAGEGEGLEMVASQETDSDDTAAWFLRPVSPSHRWEALQKEWASEPEAN